MDGMRSACRRRILTAARAADGRSVCNRLHFRVSVDSTYPKSVLERRFLPCKQVLAESMAACERGFPAG